LPRAELEAMYARILAGQIAPPDADEAAADGAGERLQQRRLAAAMGLTLRRAARPPDPDVCLLNGGHRATPASLAPVGGRGQSGPGIGREVP